MRAVIICVTSRKEVWIETVTFDRFFDFNFSYLSHERYGLKRRILKINVIRYRLPLTREVWIETHLFAEALLQH